MDAERKQLREWLAWLIRGGGAHWSFEEAIDIPPPKRGARAQRTPYSPWRVLEHMRICQRDILDFSLNPDYEPCSYPDGYWPEGLEPPCDEAWKRSVDRFTADRSEMIELVKDPETDLFAEIPWGDGQNVLREALLVADHNSYHLGQMELVRRLIGAFPDYEEAPDNV